MQILLRTGFRHLYPLTYGFVCVLKYGKDGVDAHPSSYQEEAVPLRESGDVVWVVKVST